MYLSRLTLNSSRMAVLWVSNPYRIHQRLTMACEGDPRILFRIEDQSTPANLLVQTHLEPGWEKAFNDFHVLATNAESKPVELQLQEGEVYHFRLHANPVVSQEGKRLGLLKEEKQRAWLEGKFRTTGAILLGVMVTPMGFLRSFKEPRSEQPALVHYRVCFDGTLRVTDPVLLEQAVAAGIGPAKGFGCGLLSLARA